MQIVGAMRTDLGLVRELNEDTVAWITPQDASVAASHGSLALVADGMGGHAAGEVASALAADVIRRLYYDLNGPVPKVLDRGVFRRQPRHSRICRRTSGMQGHGHDLHGAGVSRRQGLARPYRRQPRLSVARR